VHLVKQSGAHPFHEISRAAGRVGNRITNEPPRQSRLSEQRCWTDKDSDWTGIGTGLATRKGMS